MMDYQNQNEHNDEILSAINMTPLIDVMLVLLIIFMVTSSVALESGLSIDLPKVKDRSGESGQDKAVIVSLDRDGFLAVDGRDVTMEKMEEEIRAALEKQGVHLVIFEGDKDATLGRTVHIMEMALEAGADKFAIATETVEKSKD